MNVSLCLASCVLNWFKRRAFIIMFTFRAPQLEKWLCLKLVLMRAFITMCYTFYLLLSRKE